MDQMSNSTRYREVLIEYRHRVSRYLELIAIDCSFVDFKDIYTDLKYLKRILPNAKNKIYDLSQ